MDLVETDVLVIGAGGAGMRGAIAAAEMGARTTVICKSLLGKAHTVMAEGGMAAALANVAHLDSWEAHFADTMKGGKLLNNWRKAYIHATEAPERVLELERWGAIFDRTHHGYIHQRPFGAHTYPRLAHIGDRTGLELIRTLQDRMVHRENVDVHMEVTVFKLLTAGGRVTGALAYRRADGGLVHYKCRSILLATGGAGKIYRVTSNSWESTGDGTALAYDAGGVLQDCEMVQFHPTGMVWPPGVRGILVTEGVRGEGGVLKNKDGERFMERYDHERMELSSRDIVARAIHSEVQAGRGTPHGGAYLDITHKSADYIKRKLPSMYEQFHKLAHVDITREPMEVAPTVHYWMGGLRVDAETGAADGVAGLFGAGEVVCGLHGANRLGGNSLTDLLVFGKRAGEAAAEFSPGGRRAKEDKAAIDQAVEELLAPLQRRGGESPYKLMGELQDLMSQHCGIQRDEATLTEGLEKLLVLKERVANCGTGGPTGRAFNPGWHTAQDVRMMIVNAEAVLRSAIERKESRGAHARTDYTKLEPHFEKIHFVAVRGGDGQMRIEQREVEPVPYNLTEVISQSYEKYTPEETE